MAWCSLRTDSGMAVAVADMCASFPVAAFWPSACSNAAASPRASRAETVFMTEAPPSGGGAVLDWLLLCPQQPPQRPLFNLPDALTCDAEAIGNLLQRLAVRVAESEAELQHLAFTRAECR